ncbi:hypothetical protein N9X24_01220 [Rickettsiales bacterium]|nr:hypothetical protein [Rickettsiales bacterium]
MRNIINKVTIIGIIFAISSCGYLGGVDKIYIKKNKEGDIVKKIEYKNGNIKSKIFDHNKRLSKEYIVTTYQRSDKNDRSNYYILSNIREYQYHHTGEIKQIIEKLINISDMEVSYVKTESYDKKGNLISISENKDQTCLIKYFNNQNQMIKAEKCIIEKSINKN